VDALEEQDRSDRAWVEQVTGGVVTSFEHAPGGGSRGMRFVDVETSDGSRLELVVRRETGGGPYAGSQFTLERESVPYRALAGTGVRIPRFHALADDGNAILAARVHGSNDFHGIADPDEKEAVRRSFLRELARLHALDPDSLDLAGFDLPETPRQRAESWLGVWRHFFETRIRRPVPLLRFAIGWLERHAPEAPGRRALCHGDVGPGNFVHADGEVSALLDWELCHVGDVHDDLGMLALRGHQLNAFGDLTEDLRYYEAVSGTEVDTALVRYYRAVALVLALTTSVAQLDNPTDERVQVPLYLHLVPGLHRLLADALAELAGVEWDAPEPPEVSPARSDLEVLAVIADAIKGRDSDDVVLGAGVGDLLAHLDASARFGRSIESDDLDEVMEVLGVRPPSFDAALVELDRAVAEGTVDVETFLGWCCRSSWRRIPLWPAWSAPLSVPLLPVTDPSLGGA